MKRGKNRQQLKYLGVKYEVGTLTDVKAPTPDDQVFLRKTNFRARDILHENNSVMTLEGWYELKKYHYKISLQRNMKLEDKIQVWTFEGSKPWEFMPNFDQLRRWRILTAKQRSGDPTFNPIKRSDQPKVISKAPTPEGQDDPFKSLPTAKEVSNLNIEEKVQEVENQDDLIANCKRYFKWEITNFTTVKFEDELGTCYSCIEPFLGDYANISVGMNLCSEPSDFWKLILSQGLMFKRSEFDLAYPIVSVAKVNTSECLKMTKSSLIILKAYYETYEEALQRDANTALQSINIERCQIALRILEFLWWDPVASDIVLLTKANPFKSGELEKLKSTKSKRPDEDSEDDEENEKDGDEAPAQKDPKPLSPSLFDIFRKLVSEIAALHKQKATPDANSIKDLLQSNSIVLMDKLLRSFLTERSQENFYDSNEHFDSYWRFLGMKLIEIGADDIGTSAHETYISDSNYSKGLWWRCISIDSFTHVLSSICSQIFFGCQHSNTSLLLGPFKGKIAYLPHGVLSITTLNEHLTLVTKPAAVEVHFTKQWLAYCGATGVRSKPLACFHQYARASDPPESKFLKSVVSKNLIVVYTNPLLMPKRGEDKKIAYAFFNKDEVSSINTILDKEIVQLHVAVFNHKVAALISGNPSMPQEHWTIELFDLSTSVSESQPESTGIDIRKEDEVALGSKSVEIVLLDEIREALGRKTAIFGRIALCSQVGTIDHKSQPSEEETAEQLYFEIPDLEKDEEFLEDDDDEDDDDRNQRYSPANRPGTIMTNSKFIVAGIYTRKSVRNFIICIFVKQGDRAKPRLASVTRLVDLNNSNDHDRRENFEYGCRVLFDYRGASMLLMTVGEIGTPYLFAISNAGKLTAIERGCRKMFAANREYLKIVWCGRSDRLICASIDEPESKELSIVKYKIS